ncbi:MAG: hypothetical protein NC177_06750 [Ruminococcus flavefaciens]|nr:hypothetical protein [Ruminococcus flavefaciens]
MGLFESKRKKDARKLAESLAESAKQGYFTCFCGRPQRITYYGSNDTWTCPACGRRNYCR